MKIFIDSQFQTTYNEEVRKWVYDNIIYPLKDHEIKIAKNEDDMLSCLDRYKYDLYIITGYSALPLTKIENGKVISIIYDMNIEKFSSKMQNAQIDTIISEKAKLIFLSSKVITPNETVKEDIKRIYAGFKELFDYDKFIEIKNFKNFINKDFKPSKDKRSIAEKYIIMNFSMIGYSNFMNIPFIFQTIDNEFPFKVICLGDYDNELFVKEVEKRNLADKLKWINRNNFDSDYVNNLYKFAIASFFISEYDVMGYEVLTSMQNKCLTMLNQDNAFYRELCGDLIGYCDFGQNFETIIKTLSKIKKDVKDSILEMQNNVLEKISNEELSHISKITNFD